MLYLVRPLKFRGRKGATPKAKKLRGVLARTNWLFRGKSVTYVMRSCPSGAVFGASPKHYRAEENFATREGFRNRQHARRVRSPERRTR